MKLSDVSVETGEPHARPLSESEEEPKSIAIAGPSGSGKTLLVSTLLFTQHLSNEVVDAHPTLEKLWLHAPSTEVNFQGLTILKAAYEGILFAHHTEATRTPYSLDFKLNYQHKQVKSGIFGRSTGPDSGELEITPLVLWDGPGGAFTKSSIAAEGAAARAKQADGPLKPSDAYAKYIEAFRGATGIVLCLPVLETDYSNLDFNELEGELTNLLEYHVESPVRYIAVCLTKFDTLFTGAGSRAFALANNPTEVASRVRNIANGEYGKNLAGQFGDVVTVLRNLEGCRPPHARHPIEIRIFPVSTYGFVNGSGSANFYPHPDHPGLMTRALSAEDLNGQNGSHPSRDHYPAPISQPLATRLWQPFNLVAPFYYAATGEVATKHCLKLDDLVPRTPS